MVDVVEVLRFLKTVNPFLILLTVNPLVRFIFFYVFPIGFCVLLGWGMIHELLLMSKPAKTFRRAKTARNASIVAAVDDSGVLNFMLGKADIGEGMIHVGNPGGLTFFIPTQIRNLATYKPIYVRDEEGNPVKDKEGNYIVEPIPVANEEVLKYNELLKNKSVVEDLRLPIYFGSYNSSVAASLALMDAAEASTEDALSDESEVQGKPRYLFRMFSIGTLKALLNLSITPEALQRYGENWKLWGELGKPKGSLKKFMIPFIILAVVVAFIVLAASGVLDTSTWFGGVMPE